MPSFEPPKLQSLPSIPMSFSIRHGTPGWQPDSFRNRWVFETHNHCFYYPQIILMMVLVTGGISVGSGFGHRWLCGVGSNSRLAGGWWGLDDDEGMMFLQMMNGLFYVSKGQYSIINWFKGIILMVLVVWSEKAS